MEEEKEKKEQQTEKNQEWDKYRQQADQERANREKIAAERDELAGELVENQEKISTLEKQIADLKDAQSSKVKVDELDPDVYDAKLVAHLSKLKEELEAEKTKTAGLLRLAEELKADRQARQQETEKQKTIEKICKPLDSKYGAKYRNAAQELANKKIADKSVPVPKDALDARDLLDSCYAELAEKDNKEVKKPEPVDDGVGGTFILSPDKKTGTVEEVLSDMRKSFKRKDKDSFF